MASSNRKMTYLRSPYPARLATKEQWRRFVDVQQITPFQQLSDREFNALGDRDRRIYNHNRAVWHSHYGFFPTRQVQAVQSSVGLILKANQQPIGRARTAVLVEAESGLGKTSLIDDLLKMRDRDLRDIKGDYTDSGNERHPILRVSVTGGKITFLGFMRLVANYYAVPGSSNKRSRISQPVLLEACLDHIIECETEIVFIDEVQNLPWGMRSQSSTREFLRALSNHAPVSVIYAGVDMSGTGFWGGEESQQRRRTVEPLSLSPYSVVKEQDRKEWISILKSLEKRLILRRHAPGTFEKMSDYIWARTSGNLKSLDTLYNISAATAIETGKEEIDMALLESVTADKAADSRARDRIAELAAIRRAQQEGVN